MTTLSIEKFADRLLELIPNMVRGMMRYENNYLTRGEITIQQLWALECLSHKGTCRMRELADAMCMQFSSATGLVDRMTKQGLVTRMHSEEDRRAVHVAIAKKGKRILSQIYNQKRKGIMEIFGRLSQKERSEYLSIVEKLAHELTVRKK